MTNDPACNRQFERVPTEVLAQIIIEGFPYPEALISNISEGGAYLCINLTCFDIFDCLSRFEGAPATILANLSGHPLPLQGVIRRTHTNTFSVVFKSSPRTKVVTNWLMAYARGDESILNKVDEVLKKPRTSENNLIVPERAGISSQTSDAKPSGAVSQQATPQKPTPKMRSTAAGHAPNANQASQTAKHISENTRQDNPNKTQCANGVQRTKSGIVIPPSRPVVQTQSLATPTLHANTPTQKPKVGICAAPQGKDRAKFLLPGESPLGEPNESDNWTLMPMSESNHQAW